MVHISDIISGKTPFPHPNTATPQGIDSDQTLVMGEGMVFSPAPIQSASKPAAVLGTTETNICSQERNVDYLIRDRWSAVSPKKCGSRRQQNPSYPLRAKTTNIPCHKKNSSTHNQFQSTFPSGFQSVNPI
jgi:hypothetical protein